MGTFGFYRANYRVGIDLNPLFSQSPSCTWLIIGVFIDEWGSQIEIPCLLTFTTDFSLKTPINQTLQV